MKKTNRFPLKKNERVTLRIEDIGVGGEGIGFVRIPVEKETYRALQDPDQSGSSQHTSAETDGGQQVSPEKRQPRFPVFVKDAVPGDTIEAVITKAAPRYAYGHLNRILHPSPDRVTPPCPIAKTCGGCQIQAMSYAKQLEFKQRKVRESLIRIGGFAPETIDTLMHPIVGMEDPWHYRNKEQVPVQQGRYGPVTGFYASHSHTVIPMTDCLIGSPDNKRILETILSWMQQHAVPAYDETTGKGLIRHILIRSGLYSGQIMVCIIANDYRLPFEKELVQMLAGLSFEDSVKKNTGSSAEGSGGEPAGTSYKESPADDTWKNTAVPHIASISLNTNTERTNVIMGRSIRTLWGSDDIEDTLYIHTVKQDRKENAQKEEHKNNQENNAGKENTQRNDNQKRNTVFTRTDESVTFRISPLSFYQVNPRQTEKLYSLALSCAGMTGNETVWDLYCGVGTISLFMARHAGHVYGVEVIPEAIENARQNAARNGIENAEFFVGKAEDVLPAYVEDLKRQKKDPQIDVICVDPPRKGCDEKCIATMLEIAPKRIVYVSCDPATLARDLKKLTEGGYELEYVQPVDQFGHSVHVEAVCLLSNQRYKPDSYVRRELDAEDHYRIKDQG